MRKKKTFRDSLDGPLQQLHDILKRIFDLGDSEAGSPNEEKQLKTLLQKRDKAIFACVKADKTQLYSNPIITQRIERAQRFCDRTFLEKLSVAVKGGIPSLPTEEELTIEGAVIGGKDEGKSLQEIFNSLPAELVGDDYESFKKKVSRNPNLRGIDRASKELAASKKADRQ